MHSRASGKVQDDEEEGEGEEGEPSCHAHLAEAENEKTTNLLSRNILEGKSKNCPRTGFADASSAQTRKVQKGAKGVQVMTAGHEGCTICGRQCATSRPMACTCV